MRAMILTAGKSLRANVVRFIFTAASVVLGVAFVAGSFVFTDSISARFDTLFSDVFAGVDATVRSAESARSQTPAPFDESVLDVVSNVDGVEAAVGGVAGTAVLIDDDGNKIGRSGPPNLGFSWTDQADVTPLKLKDGGRGPSAADEIVMDAATAALAGLEPGDTVTVETTNGSDVYTIVGLVRFGTEDNLAGATLTSFTLDEARRVFDLEGQLTSIDVIAADGVSSEQVTANVSQALAEGSGLEVVTGAQQTNEELDQIAGEIEFINRVLLAFAGIALFVGAFVIQNTFRITVAQRTRELALLRALGADRRQVTVVVLLEATLIGLVASALGVVAGIGLAEGAKAALGAAGIGLPDGPLTVEPRTVVLSMAVGLIITVVSALLPARRAASVAPIQAMGEPVARTTRRSLRTRALVGSVVVAVGALVMAFGLVTSNGSALAMVGAGAVALFLGASTLAPLAAVPVARVLSIPLPGISGTLARENTIRQPRRTASTASALMIGIALVALVSILAASVKASVTETLEQDVLADLTVAAPAPMVGVSPVAVERLQASDELGSVSPVFTGTAVVGGQDVTMVGIDPDTMADVYNLDASFDVTQLGDGMLAAENVAEAQGWKIGEFVTVDYGAEQVETELVGTYADSLFGDYAISDSAFTEHVDDGMIGLTLIRLADGVELEQGVAAAEQALAPFPSLGVETRSETVAAAGEQIDALVGLLYGLLFLALIIALLGIANTLALSIVERTREIGLLRAVGLSRRQVRSMIRTEAVMTAMFGAFMGVLIGTAIGFGVVRSLADQGLGTFEVPVGVLATSVVAAAVAGVAAAAGPARKASRLKVLDAIAHS